MEAKQDGIKEGNRSIGEFMDISNFEIDSESGRFLVCRNCPITGWYDMDELKYHSSFDWLMPAWVKFKNLEFKSPYPQGHYRICEHIKNAICNGDIELSFSELVEGIKWFNQTQKR